MPDYIGVLNGFLTPQGGISGELSSDGSLQGLISYPSEVVVDVYSGDYVVDPDFDGRVLDTRDKLMTDDVTINAIRVTKTSNLFGGQTVVIG